VASQSCPVAHKFSPAFIEAPVVGFSGRVAAVDWRGRHTRQGGGVRGEVRGWSAASRRRCLFGVGTIPFHKLRRKLGGSWVFLTLTYGEDPGPDVFRRDRKVFLDRLRRRLGGERLFWKVEFHQHWRGGVPHLHVLTWVPWSEKDRHSLAEFRAWLWESWKGTTGRPWRVDASLCDVRDTAMYLAFDMAKWEKGQQYRVPASWQHVGRWWAFRGLYADWSTFRLDAGTYRKVHRLVRRYRQANAPRKIKCGRNRQAGRMWALGVTEGALAADIARYLQSLPEVGDNSSHGKA
jgi:hypothetical protein